MSEPCPIHTLAQVGLIRYRLGCGLERCLTYIVQSEGVGLLGSELEIVVYEQFSGP